MKKILLPLVFLFSGCLVYEQPTYPILDGTYELTEIYVSETDLTYSEAVDSYSDLSLIYPNPVGPLDSMKVHKTKIHLSGNRLHIGYYVQGGQPKWRYVYDFTLMQDILTGGWDYMEVDYVTDSGRLVRDYKVESKSLERLRIKCSPQFDSNTHYTYWLSFDRIGP